MEDLSDFPDDLPGIEPQATFRFACGPDSPCFNRCCAQLNLPLTPYDVIRITHNMELKSQEFLRLFTGAKPDGETGFPMFHLRMVTSPDAPCPFVTPAGCSVYDDRPGACRAYPLGRGAKMGRDGICERFFMVREEHCQGFGSGAAFTPALWFADQGLAKYVEFDDRYMRLLSLVKASGKPIGERLYSMALLSLWQMDNFLEFLLKMKVLDQVAGPAAEQSALLESGLPGCEARLALGLSWLELIIFGKAPDLWRKG